MYKEEIHFEIVTLTVLVDLTPVTLSFDLVTPNLLGFLFYAGWMCCPRMRWVGQYILG